MSNSCKKPCSNDRLRLLVVTSLFPPAAGGAAQAFRALSEAWEQEEAVEQILILCERRADSPARENKGKTLVRRFLPARDSRPKPNLIQQAILAAATYVLITFVIAWYVHRRGWRLVVVHERFGRRSFLRALKFCGARVVVYVSGHLPPPKRFASCDAAICVTESVYDLAVQQLPRGFPTRYVPLAFTPPRALGRQSPTVEVNSPYFLFVGTIIREKGVDLLLEAFSAFYKEHPEYRLVLAGPIRDASLPAIAVSGATFLGPRDQDAVISLIQNAEALVLPSRSEGLPRVCLEAIALGTKVICPPGIPELARVCPEWILPAVTVRDVLEKLRWAVDSSFHVSYDFERHNPKFVGKQFLEVCRAVLRDKATVQDKAQTSEALHSDVEVGEPTIRVGEHFTR